MSSLEKREEAIRLGDLASRLRKKLAEVEAQIDALFVPKQNKAVDTDAEDLLAEGSQRPAAKPTAPPARVPQPSPGRRNKYPEGPPLNKKVMDFLRKVKRPCSFEEVRAAVDAHRQSIQVSFRDLERRGYLVKLDSDQWMAIEGKKSKLTALK